MPAGAGAAEAGWNWSAPQTRMSAAPAVANTAGRLEGRFIVNLAVYAGLSAAGRLPLNVNDPRESLCRQYSERRECMECITASYFPGPGVAAGNDRLNGRGSLR